MTVCAVTVLGYCLLFVSYCVGIAENQVFHFTVYCSTVPLHADAKCATATAQLDEMVNRQAARR